MGVYKVSQKFEKKIFIFPPSIFDGEQITQCDLFFFGMFILYRAMAGFKLTDTELHVVRLENLLFVDFTE